MNDLNTLQQIVQLSQIGNRISVFARQMELQRFWSEELAKPRCANPKRLLRYGFKIHSQNDEDGIIQEIFKRIGTANRIFIEFGVETGNECNTAKLLIEGWRGLWIESAPHYAAEIRRALAAFLGDGQLTLTESLVTSENVNVLFEQAGFKDEIDLLSIDIDGNDYWVWKAIAAVNPRVVVIEYNATLRPPLSVVVPYEPTRQWDGSIYSGASLEALVRLGRTKGYRIVGCNFSGSNAFFVREDVCGESFLNPATAEEHYEPARYYFGALAGPGQRARLGPYVTV